MVKISILSLFTSLPPKKGENRDSNTCFLFPFPLPVCLYVYGNQIIQYVELLSLILLVYN